jgi:hypothetical protein
LSGSTLAEKFSEYDKTYHITNESMSTYLIKLVDEVHEFCKQKKIINVSHAKSPLKIVDSNTLNMSILEVSKCPVDGNLDRLFGKHINLYVSDSTARQYNSLMFVNTIVHEYIHYLQYEKDRETNNKLSGYFNNISTGEGVAFFFEEYMFEKGFRGGDYAIVYYSDQLYRLVRFIVGYEIHVQRTKYTDAVKRFFDLAITLEMSTVEYEVQSLISDNYSMEYYMGKYLIRKYIASNPNFDINNLLNKGSIPLRHIFSL